MLLDHGVGPELLRCPAGHHAGGLQALGVYIVQSNGATVQFGEGQHIGQQALSELHAPGADKGYLHGSAGLRIRMDPGSGPAPGLKRR